MRSVECTYIVQCTRKKSVFFRVYDFLPSNLLSPTFYTPNPNPYPTCNTENSTLENLSLVEFFSGEFYMGEIFLCGFFGG